MHHATQAFHGLVVGIVQGVEPVGQQLDCLTNASGLVDAALLADRQVHRQVQKRILPVRVGCVHVGQRSIDVGQFGVVFGVFVNPLADEHFHGFERGGGSGLGINTAEKSPHIGLGGLDQHAGDCP